MSLIRSPRIDPARGMYLCPGFILVGLAANGKFEGRHPQAIGLAGLRSVAGALEASFLAALRSINLDTALFAILGLLLAGLLGAFFHNRRQRQVYDSVLQAEKKMRETQDEIRATLYSIDDAVIATDRQSCITRLNPAAARLTGWSEAEALGRPLAEVFQIIHEITRAVVPNPAERILREGVSVPLAGDILLIARDGIERPIADSGAPIRAENGQVCGVVIVLRDQSAQRETQRALQNSQERYRQLVEVSPDAIFVNRQNRVDYLNPAALDLFGASAPEEVLGKSPFDLFHPDHHAGIRERIGRMLEEHESVPLIEERIVRLDGSLRDVEVSAAPFIDAGGVAIQVILRDITTRTQAQEALRRQNEYLAALQETTLELVSQFDLNLLLDHIARRAAQLMRTSSCFLDLIDPESGHLIPRVGLGSLAFMPPSPAPGEGLTGTVWQTGQPILVDDYARWRGRMLHSSLNGIHSAVGVPLLSGDKVLGVLGLAYDDSSPSSFGAEAVDFLTQFARLATLAIENARLFEAAQGEIHERKRVEAALKESKEKLEMLFEYLPVGVSVFDREHQLIIQNPALEKILGGGPQKLRQDGSDPFTYLRPDGSPMPAHEFASTRVLQGESQALHVETGLKKEDGTIVWTDVSAVASPFPDWSSVTVTVDISARKQIETRLNQNLEELRRWQTVTLGRETRILELKREVNDLLAQAGQPLRYARIEELRHE